MDGRVWCKLNFDGAYSHHRAMPIPVPKYLGPKEGSLWLEVAC